MKMIRISLIIVLVISLLTACDSWDDLVDSIGGSDSDDTTTTKTDSTTSTTTTSSDSSSSSDYTNISGTGIVWKPIAEKDGKLVILTPTSFGSSGATIYSTDKKKIEKGDYIGKTNGNRATYRFDKPGAKYDSPCLLYVKEKYYYVKDSSKRYN